VTVQYSIEQSPQCPNYPLKIAADAEATGSATRSLSLGSLFQAGLPRECEHLHTCTRHLKCRLARVGTEGGRCSHRGRALALYNEFSHNVIYNWLEPRPRGRCSEASQTNFVANFYLAGPGGDEFRVGRTSTGPDQPPQRYVCFQRQRIANAHLKSLPNRNAKTSTGRYANDGNPRETRSSAPTLKFGRGPLSVWRVQQPLNTTASPSTRKRPLRTILSYACRALVAPKRGSIQRIITHDPKATRQNHGLWPTIRSNASHRVMNRVARLGCDGPQSRACPASKSDGDGMPTIGNRARAHQVRPAWPRQQRGISTRDGYTTTLERIHHDLARRLADFLRWRFLRNFSESR